MRCDLNERVTHSSLLSVTCNSLLEEDVLPLQREQNLSVSTF